MKRLRNVVSGIEGIFVRITHPTGKPQTTVIKLANDLYNGNK